VDAGALVGTWSADAIYSPGAQQDDIVDFIGGGSGQLTHRNAMAEEACTFTWSLVADRLTLVGVEAWFEKSRPYERRVGKADLDVTVTVTISEEDRPKGRMRVLRLDVPQDGSAGLLKSAYGFVRWGGS
jgi:hypothetical protein